MSKPCPTGSLLKIVHGRKLSGPFCKETLVPKGRFDPKSFRLIPSGKAWLTVGCPKGKFQPRKMKYITDRRSGRRRAIRGVCSVGTRQQNIFRPLPRSLALAEIPLVKSPKLRGHAARALANRVGLSPELLTDALEGMSTGAAVTVLGVVAALGVGWALLKSAAPAGMG